MFDAAVYLGLFFNGKVSICLCYLWWISCYKSKHQWIEQYLVDWQQILSGIGQKLAIWCYAEWIIYQILSSLTTFNCSDDIVNLYRLFIFDYCFNFFSPFPPLWTYITVVNLKLFGSKLLRECCTQYVEWKIYKWNFSEWRFCLIMRIKFSWSENSFKNVFRCLGSLSNMNFLCNL